MLACRGPTSILASCLPCVRFPLREREASHFREREMKAQELPRQLLFGGTLSPFPACRLTPVCRAQAHPENFGDWIMCVTQWHAPLDGHLVITP